MDALNIYPGVIDGADNESTTLEIISVRLLIKLAEKDLPPSPSTLFYHRTFEFLDDPNMCSRVIDGADDEYDIAELVSARLPIEFEQ